MAQKRLVMDSNLLPCKWIYDSVCPSNTALFVTCKWCVAKLVLFVCIGPSVLLCVVVNGLCVCGVLSSRSCGIIDGGGTFAALPPQCEIPCWPDWDTNCWPALRHLSAGCCCSCQLFDSFGKSSAKRVSLERKQCLSNWRCSVLFQTRL